MMPRCKYQLLKNKGRNYDESLNKTDIFLIPTILFSKTDNYVMMVAEGLNFISILLAAFAARDFVQAVRMGKFYLEMRKKNAKKNDENTKK